jgi:hypothetical protein
MAANLIALGDLKSLSLSDKNQELCLGVSLLLLTCYIDYLKIVYTMHDVHINSLCLNRHLKHLLCILHYILFYSFQRMSVPSAGDLIFNCAIFGTSAGCKHVSECIGKILSSH